MQAPLLEFRRGDPRVVQRVLEWARSAILASPYRVPASDLDDVSQETMLRLWLVVMQGNLEVRRDFRALVRRIATCRCIDWHRRQGRFCALHESLPDQHGGADTFLAHREDHARLQRAMARLSSGNREILLLHFYENWSYTDIAALLDRAASTVRVRALLALRSLRQDFERCSHSSEPRGGRRDRESPQARERSVSGSASAPRQAPGNGPGKSNRDP